MLVGSRGGEAVEAAAWDPMVSELHRANDKDPAPTCSTRLPLQQLATPGAPTKSNFGRPPRFLSVRADIYTPCERRLSVV
jgi:hypothetical protein